jgi:hypothetical protein
MAAAFAFALLAGCGGGGGGGGETDRGTAALKVSQPGELTTYVQRVLRSRAAARQAGDASAGGATGVPSVMPAPAAGAAPTTASAAFSTSLTQERDVDEPDLVKTADGTTFVHLDLQDAAKPLVRVTARSATGALTERGSAAVSRGDAAFLSPRGLVLAPGGQALAVASEGWAQVAGNPCVDLCPLALLPSPIWMRSLVAVERFDVADPTKPAAGARMQFDGRLVDARQVGPYLVLVSDYQPLFAADQLPATATPAEREAAIAATRGTDALPRLRGAGGSTRVLMDETDCWVQPANASNLLSITTLTVVDLRAADLAPVSRCFIGGTEALYMTTRTIYLASTRWAYSTGAAGGNALRYPETMRTDIHKFALDTGGRITYRASGDIEGHLGWDAQRKSYRLSEHEGSLRALSFTGPLGWFTLADAASTPPSPATLTVLRDNAAGQLEMQARLPNTRRPEPLGKPGEQVHGVRFAGSRGYVVTFRQIDPLYVLDLADAADPRIAGVLEAPGFSDHLVPLSERWLLGVGKDADPATGRARGVKISLFDVADTARPREAASQVFGAAGSQSGLDASRQGLAMLAQGPLVRLSTPLFLYDAGFANPRDGLQRLEADLTAGTLTAKPLLAPAGAATSLGNLAQQRSVLVGDQVIWLRAGQLSSFGW